MEGRISPDPVYKSRVERSRQESWEVLSIALEYYFHPSRYPQEELYIAEKMITQYNLMSNYDTYKVNVMLVLIFFIFEGFLVFPIYNISFHTDQIAFPEIPPRFEDAIDERYFALHSAGSFDRFAVFYLLSDRRQMFELKIFRFYSYREQVYHAHIFFAPLFTGDLQEPKASISLEIFSFFIDRNKWISLALYFRERMKKALYEKIGQARGDSPRTIWGNRPLTKTSPAFQPPSILENTDIR